MYKKGLILFFVAVLTLALAACGKDSHNQSSDHKGKLDVKTTVYPLKSFAQQIGGKYVNVESVYPKGVDPHTYDPSQKQMVDIGKSDLFLYTGDNLDPVAKKIAKAINDKDKTLSLESTLDKNKDLLKGEEHEHEHGEGHEHGESHEDEHEHEHHHHGKYDPHIWLDPVVSQKFAKAIKDELIEKDSKHKSFYISHDSIGYLAERYHFEQEGIENMNAEEPSQKDLTNIVKQIKEDKVKNILIEENVSHKVADTVRKETNAKTIKFYNMGSHTKQQDDDNNTYQSFMKENIKAIEKALQNE